MGKKNITGGRKNNDNDDTEMVVLKIDMHCEGCARKIVKYVLSLHGVKKVDRGENELTKITVASKVDPVKLRKNVEEKIKKKVELMSPTTKKPTAAVNGEDKPIKLPLTTTVLKVPLHCQGCIEKIRKLVRKTEGFRSMSIDENNDLVTVKGRIDVNLLTVVLMNKLNKKVEVVPAKGGGDGKKGKGGDGGDGKKGKGGDGGDGEGEKSSGEGRRMEGYKMEYLVNQSHYSYLQGVNGAEYTYNYMHITRMFNDENPNACVIM